MDNTKARRAAMPLWLFYSLLSLLGFAGWALFSTAASKQLSPWQVQVFSTLGMAPVAAAAAFASDFLEGSNLRLGSAWAFFTGAVSVVANVALFTALSAGTQASVIFPLTGMYPLVTILIARIFLRERVGQLQKWGIGVALVAILLLSLVDGGGSGSAKAHGGLRQFIWIGLSVVCLLGWGITGVTQKLATRYISNGLSIVAYVFANLVVSAAIAIFHPLVWDIGWSAWFLCLAVGVSFGLGTLLLFAAYPAGGKVSIVSVLTSLYPAITVSFAVPLFGERITSVKAIGILLAIIAGVVLSREGE